MGRRIQYIPISKDLEAVRPSDADQYWNRLKNLIPTEVTALYIAGAAVIPAESALVGLLVWSIFCLLGTIAFVAKESTKNDAEPGKVYPVDWVHVAISAVSFIIWVYVLGGPFAHMGAGVHLPWLGSLLMMAWTFIVPFFYKPVNK